MNFVKRKSAVTVRLCENIDSYDCGNAGVVRDARTGPLPSVEFTDIEACLAHGLSIAIGEEIKAYKTMNVPNYLTNGRTQLEPYVRVPTAGALFFFFFLREVSKLRLACPLG